MNGAKPVMYYDIHGKWKKEDDGRKLFNRVIAGNKGNMERSASVGGPRVH